MFPDVIVKIAQDTAKAGGRAFLVGGCVRDMLLGLEPKDYDIEVHGLDLEKVARLAEEHGSVDLVGKSFAVLKVKCEDGIEIDMSLPRTEHKTGEGHRGFKVAATPELGIVEALRRRDFTMNAIAMDILSSKLRDPFRGERDLADGVLRIVDAQTFVEDPLRVLRAVQFMARFNLRIEYHSERIIRNIAHTLVELPKERVLEELKKLLLKSKEPSIGLRFAQQVGVLKLLFPELEQLIGARQDPDWHPEGDVFEHTCLAIDEAAKHMAGLDEHKALVLMLSVLLHDVGKVHTSEVRDSRITAHGHAEVGAVIANNFLIRLGVDNLTREKVVKLVGCHMRGFALHRNRGSKGAVRRLARDLWPATISELCTVMQADKMGRGAEEAQWLYGRAVAVEVTINKPVDIVQGRDLIEMKFPAGPNMGRVISEANRLHEELGMSREEILGLIELHVGLPGVLASMSFLK